VVLGLPGFVASAAAEYGGELELVVETTDTSDGLSGLWAGGHGAWSPRPSGSRHSGVGTAGAAGVA
jgi:hypothetical protein